MGFTQQRAKAISFVAALLVYSNTFDADFVYDDSRAILTNPDVLQSTPIGQVFTNDFWGTPLNHTGSHQSYRPITVLTLRLNHQLFGLQPSPYHVTNIILHAMTTLLFCHVTSSLLFFSPEKVLLSGLLFAVHPIHTEAVAGIVGRADVLATFFFLSALLVYKRSCDLLDGRRKNAPRASEGNSRTPQGYRPHSAGSGAAPRVQTLSYQGGAGRWSGTKRKRRNRRDKRACEAGNSREADCYSTSGDFPDVNLEDVGATNLHPLLQGDRAAESDDSHTTTDTCDSSNTTTSTNTKINSNVCQYQPRKSPFNLNLFDEKSQSAGKCLGWIIFSVAVALSVLSLLSKEQGYCVLPTCLVYDLWIRNKVGLSGAIGLIFAKGATCKQLQSRVRFAVAFTLLAVLGRLSLCAQTSGGSTRFPGFSESDNPAAASADLLSRSLTFNYLLFFNALLFVFPLHLSFDWSMDAVPLLRGLDDPRNLATLAFYCAFLGALWPSWKFLRRQDRSHDGYSSSRRRSSASSTDGELPAFSDAKRRLPITELSPRSCSETECALLFGITVSSLAFLPATNLFFYVGFVVAERILYLPSVGLVILATQGLFWLRGRANIKSRCCRHAWHIFVTSLVLALACRSWLRGYDWKDELSLYSSGLTTNPAKAWGNLGNVYRTQGLRHEAEEAYVTALRHRPNMADVHYNLALLYQESGRFTDAEKSYNDSIRYRPTLALAYLNLGVVMTKRGRTEQAKQIYLQAASLSDENLRNPRAHLRAQTSALYNLGILLADEGSHVEAISAYQRALRLMPADYKAHSLYNMLGQSLFLVGKSDEAEKFFRKSLESKPDHVTAHLTYARLLSHVGRFDQSERLYLDALKLDEDSHVVHQHYSSFLTARGRLVEAAAAMDKAVTLDKGSSNYETVFNAASAHRQAKLYDGAEKLYRKAAELEPTFASAHMNLGAILHLRGKHLEARASYLVALEIKPGDVMILENLGKLENLLRAGER